MRRYSRTFLWTKPRYYMPNRKLWEGLLLWMLQKYGGPLDQFDKGEGVAQPPPAPASGSVKA